MSLVMVDYSDARPPFAELHAAGIATVGAYLFGRSALSREYVAALLGDGFSLVPIYETSATRPWDTTDPRAAGAADADGSRRQADRVGLGGAAICYVFGDTPNVAPHLVDIADYAAGIAGRDDPFTGYGAALAMSTVRLWTGAACSSWWGVEPWIAGAWSTSTPGHEAHNAELWRAAGGNVVQLVLPSPVPGTDINDTLAPYYGQYPGPAPIVTTPGDEATMIVEEVNDQGATVKWWQQTGAGYQVLDGGANPSPTGYALATSGVPVFRGCHTLTLIALAHDQAATMRHALGPAPAPPRVDDRGWAT